MDRYGAAQPGADRRGPRRGPFRWRGGADALDQEGGRQGERSGPPRGSHPGEGRRHASGHHLRKTWSASGRSSRAAPSRPETRASSRRRLGERAHGRDARGTARARAPWCVPRHRGVGLRARRDGDRSGVRGAAPAGAPRSHDGRHRPLGAERSLRRAGALLPRPSRHPRREAERKRRLHLHRPPLRHDRRAARGARPAGGSAARRAGAWCARCASVEARAPPACSTCCKRRSCR